MASLTRTALRLAGMPVEEYPCAAEGGGWARARRSRRLVGRRRTRRPRSRRRAHEPPSSPASSSSGRCPPRVLGPRAARRRPVARERHRRGDRRARAHRPRGRAHPRRRTAQRALRRRRQGLLKTDGLWRLVDEVARSPSVVEAIAHQGTGFAEQVGGRARSRSRRADAWVERVAGASGARTRSTHSRTQTRRRCRRRCRRARAVNTGDAARVPRASSSLRAHEVAGATWPAKRRRGPSRPHMPAW